MYVSKHVMLTFVFAIILYPFFGWYSLIVFFSGFLFDIDHYIYYVLKKKDFSLRNSYFYCIPGSDKYEKHLDVIHIFHTLEFWMMLAVLSLFWIEFLFVFLGLIFHMILDGISLKIEGEIRPRAWSLYGWILRH